MSRPRRQAPGPDRLAERLHAAAIHLLRRVRRADPDSGLSGPALSTLSVIVYGGPLSLGALATIEQVRPPTISRQVQALERDGLVAVRQDPADRRVRVVTTTPAGRRLLAAARHRRTAAIAELLARLPAAERRNMERAVTALEAALGRQRRHRDS